MANEGFVNTLYYGDNLKVLRDYIPTESVDLIYLDPPFNSNASYNVLFKERSGAESAAQIRAFEDTWHWGEEAERAYAEILASPLASPTAKEMVASLRRALGDKNDMTAYLAMMAVRLLELRRVLKPTGSLYLHCDPTASHYLKVVLDTIFGPTNYRSEITWRRTNIHSDSRDWSEVADILLYYVKDVKAAYSWNPIYQEHTEEYVRTKYRHDDGDGRRYRLDNMTSPHPRPNMMYEWKGHQSPAMGWRYEKATMERLDADGRIWYPEDKSKRPQLKRYLDEMEGTLLSNIWTDINPINSQAHERLGYATQKPLALLERIIQASSNAGDVVLDPFCGCGTAVAAAHKLDRRWVGIDVTHLAIALMKSRLKDMFGLEPGREYQVVGEPADLEGARQLAREDRYQFQYWAVSLATGQPRQADKKGADRGVDGVIFFLDGPQRAAHKAIIQVKSGHVTSSQVRDLKGVLERERAALGLFITLEEPTRDMRTEATGAGFFHSDLMQRDYPKVQIRTVKELLDGRGFTLPPRPAQFKQAERVKRKEGVQGALEVE